MRLSRCTTLVLTLTACGIPQRAEAAPAKAAPAKAAPVTVAPTTVAPDCGSGGAPFSTRAIARDIAFLADPALDGRKSGSAGDVTTRQHLAARFACLGVAAAADGGGYEQRFTFPLDGNTVTTGNVLAQIAGRDPEVAEEIVLVAAHHDHLGDGHLGANDNASGIAALLAVAESVVAAGGARRTIAFAAFGAEEEGLVGAQFFLAHPPAALPLAKIVQIINLDMIGSYTAKQRVHAFGAFAGLPATQLLRELDDDYPKTSVALGGHSVRGDHHGFCALGIPYVFFWTSDGRCYHRRCDTAERITAGSNAERLSDIAKLAGALALGLGDSKEDLAASRARLGCRGRASTRTTVR